MTFSGKHALVTGGGTGVGAAIALKLTQLGANVTITGRREHPLQTTSKLHANINWSLCDVTNQNSVERCFAESRAKFGSVDIVVASAGAAQSKPFHHLTTTDLQAMLDVNLIGVFNTFQAALPDMKENKWGRLVAIASTAGLKGYGYVSHYCAAKHGVIGMTKALAIEVAKQGITANAVCPSYVDTPMTDNTIKTIMDKTGRSKEEALHALVADNPQGRLITPEEVADTVAWLCGTGATAINGQAISISGGEV
jgi:3-hydroxybutyrate dehydrogenase